MQGISVNEPCAGWISPGLPGTGCTKKSFARATVYNENQPQFFDPKCPIPALLLTPTSKMLNYDVTVCGSGCE